MFFINQEIKMLMICEVSDHHIKKYFVALKKITLYLSVIVSLWMSSKLFLYSCRLLVVVPIVGYAVNAAIR